MNKRGASLLVLTTSLVLTACRGGGSSFEGKWVCNDDKGKQVAIMSIRNNGGNDYIIDDFPIIGKLLVTYKDGKLVGPQNMTFSIDKQSGKLLGVPFCEMSRK